MTPSELADKLRDIAISRGQQLRERDAEIERINKACDIFEKNSKSAADLCDENWKLKAEIERLKKKQEHKSQQVEAQVSLVSEMQSRIDSLAAERDEAREEAHRLRGQVAKIDNLIEQVQILEERLAALRSAPGMEEVESILNDANSSLFTNQERLSDLARRAIASREEVVGLLKWLHGLDITLDDGVHPVVRFADSRFADSAAYAEDHKNAKRILEIVEGK